jgi:ferredoxin-NADP reductase
MTTRQTNLIHHSEIAQNTVEFVFRRPEGFEFYAGQHVNLKLEKLLFEDKKGARRTFTIASAPFEEDIHIVTRMTGSGFKRTLMEGGSQTVEMQGPFGDMTHESALPAVFIAGGIGVTPFRSMVLQSLHQQVAASMTLLYSNRDESSAVFLPLFNELVARHPSLFHYYPVVTGETTTDAAQNSGSRRFDRDFILEHVPEIHQVMFYLCGSQQMVEAVHVILSNEKVTTDRIRSEVFWGY